MLSERQFQMQFVIWLYNIAMCNKKCVQNDTSKTIWAQHREKSRQNQVCDHPKKKSLSALGKFPFPELFVVTTAVLFFTDSSFSTDNCICHSVHWIECTLAANSQFSIFLLKTNFPLTNVCVRYICIQTTNTDGQILCCCCCQCIFTMNCIPLANC